MITNLAAILPADVLQKTGAECHEQYKSDEESRADWLGMHSDWLRLYHQLHRPSNQPWDDSSAESIPILTEGVDLFKARAYQAFFPARTFIKAIPMGRFPDPNTRERSERVAKHMSFQLTVKDKSYRKDKAAMFKAVALHGSDFSKAYYDPINKNNIIERVRATDLVVNYGYGPREIEDVERKTQIIYKSMNECQKLFNAGYFSAMPMPNQRDDTKEIQEVEDEAQGLSESTKYATKDYAKLLEQHTYFNMDMAGNKTTIALPYVITLCATSQKILRIAKRWETRSDGSENPDEATEYFTHFQYETNPDGFYGLGLGHLVYRLNLAVDKILRQSIDAGELANIGNMSGFVNEKLGTKGGEIEMVLGKFMKIPMSGEDIAKNVYQFKFPGPNAAFNQLMELLQNTAQRLASTTDAATGDINKVIQPVTLMTMLEQALQLPSSVMEQLSISFEDELEKIYDLNRQYLDEDYFIENGVPIPITRADYAADYKIMPIMDPKNITTQQKVAKAQAIYQFAMSNPLMAQDPNAVYEVTKRYLEAIETDEIDAILPPPQQQKPEDIDNQEQENALFLMPPNQRPLFDVFPDQNHLEHIRQIDNFLDYLSKSDPLQPPVPDIKSNTNKMVNGMAEQANQKLITELMEHRQKHVAFLYAQKEGLLNGQGGNPAMGAAPNNPGIAGNIGNNIQAGNGYNDMSLGTGQSIPGTAPSFGGYTPVPPSTMNGIPLSRFENRYEANPESGNVGKNY